MFRSIPLSRILLVVLLVGLLSAALTLRLAAQGPDNGEPGGASPAVPAQKSLDEEVSGAPAEPAAGPGVGPAVDSPVGNGEPQSKPISAPAEIHEEELEGSRAPGLAEYFKRWSAETFTAYDSTNTWAYDGGGCIHRIGGSPWWDMSVQVPEGAEIDYLRVYYYDTDAANNAIAYLFQYDDIGGNVNLATATGSGTAGYGSAGSGFFSHIVNNTDNSYAVRFNLGGGTTNALQVCALRIRYQYTFAALTLPAIMNLAP